MRRLCFVVTAEVTVRTFLLDQLAALARRYDVTLVVNCTDPGFLSRRGIGVHVVPLPLERKVSLFKDLKSLLGLWRILNQGRFDAVHSVTPKAGLLAMAAGAAAGVPTRLHTFTGQVWATRDGLPRMALRGADRLIAFLATRVLADSHSQREHLIHEGIVGEDRIEVLGPGSISGVDPRRFRPDPRIRSRLRARLGVAEDEVLFLFVGRVTRDKGVLDLARAFERHAARARGSWLAVVGPDEGRLMDAIRAQCGRFQSRLLHRGFTTHPERLMAAADVLCLPSYREGFGCVLIEAAAAGVPSIASRIYGITDAVQDGVTGVLHDAHDVEAIAGAMTALAGDGRRRRALGTAARKRAQEEFPQERLTGEVVRFYAQTLEERATPGTRRLGGAPPRPGRPGTVPG